MLLVGISEDQSGLRRIKEPHQGRRPEGVLQRTDGSYERKDKIMRRGHAAAREK